MSLSRDDLRTIRAAREWLLDDAKVTHDCHVNNDGEWGEEIAAKADYDHCMKVAEELRLIAVNHRQKRTR